MPIASRLTAAQCAAARVDPDRTVYLSDGHGLRLCLRPNGSKVWTLRYHVNGRERVVGLGAYPGTSLAKARIDAKEIRDRIRDGKPAREPKRAEGATFNDLADAFIRHAGRDWSAHHLTRNTYLLDSLLKPKLGKRDPRDIDRAAILDALKEPLARAPESARRARGLLAQILAYGIDTAVCEHNPAAELVRNTLFKRGKVEHFAALDVQHVGPMLSKLHASDCPPATKVALFVLLVTALREGSVRAAKWSEFDEREKLWRVPAARMKSRRDFDVPLPQAVFDALKTLPREDGVEYVFASTQSRSGFLAENTLRLALHGLGYPVTAHGMRSTFQNWATANSFHPDHIERFFRPFAERNSGRVSALDVAARTARTGRSVVQVRAGRARPCAKSQGPEPRRCEREAAPARASAIERSRYR